MIGGLRAHQRPAGPPRGRVGETRVGRTLWFTLPTGVVVFVGASTPWIAQRVPRFVFPAVAVAGAALVVLSFVNSVIRFVRRYRRQGRFRLFPVVVNLVATVFLVILPLTHLVRAMTPSGDGAPRILAGFGDWLGAEGYPRLSSHRGLDVWRAARELRCSRWPTAASAWRGTTAICAV